MEGCISLLLAFTCLAAASHRCFSAIIHRHPHLLMTRDEKQDSFKWYGRLDCPDFSKGTATGDGSFGGGYDCTCISNLTFSTENNKCVSYGNESK